MNYIINYFLSLTNGGFNSFKYRKPALGDLFVFVGKDGNERYTNYTKDREISDGYTLWKVFK